MIPPIANFKRIEVEPLLDAGREPLPEILRHVQSVGPGEGLIVIAPFLPSPLIEMLRSNGFESKLERDADRNWIVYFWHAD